MLSVVCLSVAFNVCLHSKHTDAHTQTLIHSLFVCACVECCAYVCVVVFTVFHTDVFRSENSFASLHHTLDHMCSVRSSATLVFRCFFFVSLFLRKNKLIHRHLFLLVRWLVSVFVSHSVCVLIFVPAFTRVEVFICY